MATPFKISVTDEELAYLKDRLANARDLPLEREDGKEWQDGTDRAYLKVGDRDRRVGC
jgi:hypothetical protein